MKIYIAGPITNEPNYKKRFDRVKKILIGEGHVVLNPAELPEGMEYEDYMHICFAMIDVADEILMLDGWTSSSGAIREIERATKKKINICFERLLTCEN